MVSELSNWPLMYKSFVVPSYSPRILIPGVQIQIGVGGQDAPGPVVVREEPARPSWYTSSFAEPMSNPTCELTMC